MRDTDAVWTRIVLTLTGTGALSVGAPGRPTGSGLAEVRYDYAADGSLGRLWVTAPCTAAQEDAIHDLLHDYVDEGCVRVSLGPERERVCLHDTAFEPIHDPMCSLVALDQLAAAFQIEIRATCAETAGCAGRGIDTANAAEEGS